LAEFPHRTNIFGKSGTGKTTLGLQMAENFISKHRGKVDVVVLSESLNSHINAPLYTPIRKYVRYVSSTLNEHTKEYLRHAMDISERSDKPLLVLFDDMGDTMGLRSRVDNPLMTIASQAPHKNTFIISMFQNLMQPPPRMRSNTDYAVLFKLPPDETTTFRRMFMGEMEPEAGRIINDGLQDNHDHLDIDLRDPYAPAAFRNSESKIWPSLEGGTAMTPDVFVHFLAHIRSLRTVITEFSTDISHPDADGSYPITTGFTLPVYQIELRRFLMMGKVHNIDKTNNRLRTLFGGQGWKTHYVPPGSYDLEELVRACVDSYANAHGHSNMEMRLDDDGIVAYWRSEANICRLAVDTDVDDPTQSSPLLLRMLGHIGADLIFEPAVPAVQRMGHPAGSYMGTDLIAVVIPEAINPTQMYSNLPMPPPSAIFPFNFAEDIHRWEIGTSPSIVFTFEDYPIDISRIHIQLLRVNLMFQNVAPLSVESGGMTLNFRLAV